MSSREFAEWMAFGTLEPWGFESDNWRAALIAAMVANTVRDPKKKRKPYQPEDFMPQMGKDKEPPSQDDLRSKIDQFMVAFGGKRDGGSRRKGKKGD